MSDVRRSLRAARNRLAAAGVSNPDLDAALLLAEVLGVRRERLALDPDRVLTDDEGAGFATFVERRELRVPMAHLLGRAEFWSLEFKVTKDTLSPRPETEMLVEEAVKALRGVASPVVVDIGTGTGCIAVAIAKEVPSATVHAVDISPEALAVARENVVRHGVEARVHLHEGDLFSPLADVLSSDSVDVVVSNPPYVRRDEEFDPEILHEPAMALFVDDVLDTYRAIVSAAAPVLRPGGTLLLELPGPESQALVEVLAPSPNWGEVDGLLDLSGSPRVLRAAKGPGSAGAFERVYTVNEYYDGPRLGVADLGGRPHAYRSLWGDGANVDEERFELGPINEEALAAVLEDWVIWRRWEAAFDKGRVSAASHPALPEDRARHEQLQPVIRAGLQVEVAARVIARAQFEAVPGAPELRPGVLRQLRVKWTPGD